MTSDDYNPRGADRVQPASKVNPHLTHRTENIPHPEDLGYRDSSLFVAPVKGDTILYSEDGGKITVENGFIENVEDNA